MIACHGQPIWKTVLVCMIIFALYVFIVVPYVIVQTIISDSAYCAKHHKICYIRKDSRAHRMVVEDIGRVVKEHG